MDGPPLSYNPDAYSGGNPDAYPAGNPDAYPRGNPDAYPRGENQWVIDVLGPGLYAKRVAENPGLSEVALLAKLQAEAHHVQQRPDRAFGSNSSGARPGSVGSTTTPPPKPKIPHQPMHFPVTSRSGPIPASKPVPTKPGSSQTTEVRESGKLLYFLLFSGILAFFIIIALKPIILPILGLVAIALILINNV